MNDGSDSIKHLFVVGCSRGGTTLVQRVLGSHSLIATLPETAFFQRMVAGGERRQFGPAARDWNLARDLTSRIRQLFRITGPDVAMSLDAMARATGAALPPVGRRTSYRTAAGHFVTLMDTFARYSSKTAWLEKTPSHLHYIPEIERNVPAAQFIHVVRDGISVVASLRAAAKKYPEAHWPILYNSLDRCIARWNECTRCTLRHASKPNHIVIRFEQFVASPEPQARLLCEELGFPWEAELCQSRRDSASNIYADHERWKSNVTSDISPANQTKPEDVLTDAEQSYIASRLVSLANIDQYGLGADNA